MTKMRHFNGGMVPEENIAMLNPIFWSLAYLQYNHVILTICNNADPPPSLSG